MRWLLAWIFYGLGDFSFNGYQVFMRWSANIQGPSDSGPWGATIDRPENFVGR
jgi:hypothetical protein